MQIRYQLPGTDAATIDIDKITKVEDGRFDAITLNGEKLVGMSIEHVPLYSDGQQIQPVVTPDENAVMMEALKTLLGGGAGG